MRRRATQTYGQRMNQLPPKLKPALFAAALTAATLIPAAAANAGLNLSNHNETLLLDV